MHFYIAIRFQIFTIQQFYDWNKLFMVRLTSIYSAMQKHDVGRPKAAQRFPILYIPEVSMRKT